NINNSISAVNGGLVLNAQNAISASGAVNVAYFELQNGNWSQISPTLPGFAATDFRVDNVATFLRVLGRDGSSGTPYQITDVYGLQGINGSLLNSDFVLANNINASGTANWNGGAGFRPIGNGFFAGQFDGQGFTIDHLKIAPTDSSINQIG